ncbi:MAG: hypothetical protein M1821_003256 [Bathelium mastoideum]|nr:MAG: hypothetical protein M1821_003256 [Bathelium mastoideum]
MAPENAPKGPKRMISSEHLGGASKPPKMQKQNELSNPFSDRGSNRTGDGQQSPHDSTKVNSSAGPVLSPKPRSRAPEIPRISSPIRPDTPIFFNLLSDHVSVSREIALKMQRRDQLDARYRTAVRDADQSKAYSEGLPAIHKAKTEAKRKAERAREDVDEELVQLKARDSRLIQQMSSLFETEFFKSNAQQERQIASQQSQIDRLQNQFEDLKAERKKSDEALESVLAKYEKLKANATRMETEFQKETKKARSDVDKLNAGAQITTIGLENLRSEMGTVKKLQGEEIEKCQSDLASKISRLETRIDHLKSSMHQRLEHLENGTKTLVEKHTEQIDGLLEQSSSSRSHATSINDTKDKVVGLEKSVEELTMTTRAGFKYVGYSDAANDNPTVSLSVGLRDLKEGLKGVESAIECLIEGQDQHKEEKTKYEDLSHSFRREISRIKDYQRKMESRLRLEYKSLSNDRLKRAEGETDRLKSDPPLQDQAGIGRKAAGIEQDIIRNRAQHQTPPTETSDTASTPATPLTAGPNDMALFLSNHDATGLGQLGEKFATIKFVQGHLRDVYANMDKIKEADETRDTQIKGALYSLQGFDEVKKAVYGYRDMVMDVKARLNTSQGRQNEFTQLVETLRVPIQSLEQRFDNLTTEHLHRSIVNEILRLFPDLRNYQNTTFQLQTQMHQLRQQFATQSQQAIQASGINRNDYSNNVEGLIKNHAALLQNLDGRLTDLSKRVDEVQNVYRQIYQNQVQAVQEWTKKNSEFSRNLERSHQESNDKYKKLHDRIENMQVSSNGSSDALPQVFGGLEKLIQEYNKKPVEATADVVSDSLAQLKKQVEEHSTWIAKGSKVVDETQTEIQYLKGRSKYQQEIIAKLVAAVDLLNVSNDLSAVL